MLKLRIRQDKDMIGQDEELAEERKGSECCWRKVDEGLGRSGVVHGWRWEEWSGGSKSTQEVHLDQVEIFQVEIYRHSERKDTAGSDDRFFGLRCWTELWLCSTSPFRSVIR
ncbi:hypothetical protein HZH68_013332 [Vespula germanica]|uniref:Uncharacterized protein n=1 Tax=Vespula germanica TaxID=30212 RepID=A0A834JDV3_VESGE|nr:hypothetical protein HZH68_013332 [Vespula germanica]